MDELYAFFQQPANLLGTTIVTVVVSAAVNYLFRVREALYIEIDTSLRAPRVVRVLDRMKEQGRCPQVIRVDNGPEFLSDDFRQWCARNGVAIRYIQLGKPNQNAYIERFNRTYRNEVLNLYLFRSLDEIREITGR